MPGSEWQLRTRLRRQQPEREHYGCNSRKMREAKIYAHGCGQEKTAGPTPCRPWKSYSELLSVYGFLQFGPRGEFRDFAAGDLHGCAGLGVAGSALVSLRNREGALAVR